jgi:AraC-like DNA-binding protein
MLVRELLVDVERGPTRRRSIALPHERLARAVQITLASSPGEAHSLAALATRIGASPFHLSHVFRSAMGVSVHRYLVRLRLAAALERLARGDSSISALALDLGFSTHSHFTAAFRRAFGATPREVRAILAGESSGSSTPRAQRAPAASRHAPAGSVAVPTLRLERSSPRPLGTAAWSRPTRTEAEPPDALQLGA